jgi:tetratricopeptide (TPR) repeat protein/ADP-heptose:LPS heptosyltransferase
VTQQTPENPNGNALGSGSGAQSLQDSHAQRAKALARAKQGQLQEATRIYEGLIQAGLANDKDIANCGALCNMQERFQAGEHYARLAIQINPSNASAHNSLGNALREQGDVEHAIQHHRQAIILEPEHAGMHYSLAKAEAARGSISAAIKSYKTAIALKSDYLEAQYNLSMAELLQGNYREGWISYETRFLRKHGMRTLCAQPPCRRWQGESSQDGESLALISEQGLGDTLQFMRYSPVLRRMGFDVSFCAPKRLHDLIISSGIHEAPIDAKQANRLHTGYWTPLLSVARYLHVTPDNVITNQTYIKAPDSLIKQWAQILAEGEQPRVAIHWQGNPEAERTSLKGRSLPLEAFAPIARSANIRLVSLQKGYGSEQLEHCSFRDCFVKCQPQVDQAWSFLDTAAIIANCDLVISSDSALAHLAAGMGKSTWLLLHRVPDWRWGLEGDTSIWYPSMRLFRQQNAGCWPEVIEGVQAALQQRYRERPILQQPAVPEAIQRLHERIENNHAAWDEYNELAAFYAEQQQWHKAHAILSKAIERTCDHSEVHKNMGLACKQLGDLNGAITHTRKALSLVPNDCEAHFRLGLLLTSAGNIDAAMESYRAAVTIDPNNAAYHNNLGNLLLQKGETEQALSSYITSASLRPEHAQSHYNVGNAHRLTGNMKAAEAAYRRAISLRPDHQPSHYNLALTLHEQGTLTQAIQEYTAAIRLDPEHAKSHFALGNALNEAGNLEAAAKSYELARKLNPDHQETHNNLGNVLRDMGQVEAAISCYQDAIKLGGNEAGLKNNLGIAFLQAQHYQVGWEYYESRLDDVHTGLLNTIPRGPRWRGEPLGDKDSLLVVSEQGLGDTLQFIRYVPILRQKGFEISLSIPEKLHGLIQVSGLHPSPISPAEGCAAPASPWIALLSLAKHLGVRPDRPICSASYLSCNATMVKHWQRKLRDERQPIVGINWQGNPDTEKRILRGRSLNLETFKPLAERTNVRFLSLQKGFGSEQLQTCSFVHRFVSCQHDISKTWDFLNTAAIIANCDLIITSDTAVAHLAGGMGKPTWLLLHHVPDWRWGLHGESTFWYPSMRLFRQQERGNWAEVMQRVASACAATLCE